MGAEKEFLRSFTGGIGGRGYLREDWIVVILPFSHGQVVDGRKRSTKQLQDLRHALDIEAVEG